MIEENNLVDKFHSLLFFTMFAIRFEKPILL